MSRNDQIFSSLKNCKHDVYDISTMKDIMYAITRLNKRIILRDFMEEEYANLVNMCQEQSTKVFWSWLGSKLEYLAQDDSVSKSYYFNSIIIIL